MPEFRPITLHVFSGTGNSLKAARRLAEISGVDKTSVIHINRQYGIIEAPGQGSLTGVIFPTHGFTAPWAVIRHVLKLPAGNGTKAFVVACRAGTWPGFLLPGLSGSAAFIISLLLLLKGYRVTGIRGLDMPSNWMSLHWGISLKNAEKIITRGERDIRLFGEKVLVGGRHLFTINNLFELICGILLLPVSAGYLLVGRFWLAKLFYANWRCNSCGICAAECPFGAIKMKGGGRKFPYWTFSCESCMHCMAYCPEKAVEASHPLAALLFYITSFSAAGILSVMLIKIHPAETIPGRIVSNRFAAALIDYAYILLSFYVVYFLFYYLVRLKPVNRFFTYITLTHYYRRYHEPSIERKDFRS